MTTAIHHGDPGSFKSFGVVQRVMIPALKGKKNKETKEIQGRTVVTNIRGFNDLDKIEQALNIKLAPDSEIMYVEADSQKGFEVMASFFHWAPKGALIVIDESQRVFNKRRHRNLSHLDLPVEDLQAQGIKQSDAYPYWDGDYDRPHCVENAFDQHRHYNWDIYLLTPNIGKIHPEITAVAEIAYRHKGRGHLLPWWKNKWREYAHDPESTGKQVSHYIGTPKTYKADKRIFACYQSTKTGKAQGTAEANPIYRDPKLIFALSLVGFLVPLFLYQAIGYAEEKSNLITGQSSEVPAEDDGEAGSNIGGNDLSGIRPETGLEARFNALEPASKETAKPKPKSSDTPPDRLIHYLEHGYKVRLMAMLVTPSNGKAYYRIAVSNGDDVIDQFTQDELDSHKLFLKPQKTGLEIRTQTANYLVRHFEWSHRPKQSTQAEPSQLSRSDQVKAGIQGAYLPTMM